MKKALMILSATALAAIVFVPPASAQVWSTRPITKDTLLTFSAPVSLPDVTLPAGTYLFRFVDPLNAPGVLEVRSEDSKTVYAMMDTIPIVRTESETGKSELVTFKETPVDAPVAIDAWYFDDTMGCEFLYNR
jgi:hypothetical protein